MPTAGQPYGASLTVAGVLLGGWFIKWVQEKLAAYEDISFGSLQGSSGRDRVAARVYRSSGSAGLPLVRVACSSSVNVAANTCLMCWRWHWHW